MKHERILVAVIAIIIFLAWVLALGVGKADTVYVICQPESFVWARRQPKFGAEEVAYLSVGEALETDGKTRGKWLHVYYHCEASEGWIYMGYVTESEPVIYEGGAQAVTTKQKVRSRRNAGGKIRNTLKKGARITVYAASEEWAVTDVGFIKTEFLEIGGAT